MTEAALFHRCRKALGLSTGEMARALSPVIETSGAGRPSTTRFPARPEWRSKACCAARARRRSLIA